MRDPVPPVILNRKRSASDWGSIPSRHPALDAGSSPAWIPVFTGMTERVRDPFGLDSRFHGNDKKNAGMTPPVIPHLMRDPVPPVIPHLMRDPVLPGFPFSRE